MYIYIKTYIKTVDTITQPGVENFYLLWFKELNVNLNLLNLFFIVNYIVI